MSQRKFVVCKDGDHRAENLHYADCQRRKVPFVVVNLFRTHATVQWDHITLDSHLDDILKAHSEEIKDEIRGVFQRHCSERSRYRISAFVGKFDKMETASAKDAAEEIFEILESYLAVSALATI